MQTKFVIELLQAVSDWQRGGDLKQSLRRGKKLKEVCSSLPDAYRTCHLVCYRQIALPKGGVWNLIGEELLPEKISSWTFDVQVAKAFKGGVPPNGQGYQGTILYLFPPPASVIVNLRELYNDVEFCKALEKNQSSIVGYHEGAGRYKNNQSEMVLEIDTVIPEDVYSLGGFSSPLEDLIAQAADLVYRRPSTRAEREALLLKAQDAEIKDGPKWLNMDATRRVLARTKPHAAVLAELKRQQDKV
jgi:hypothetical protein